MSDFDAGLHAYLATSQHVIAATIDALDEATMQAAIDACVTSLKNNRPILICGNGGSAADAMHIAGELIGRFLKERRALKCICLADNLAVLTAWSNDYSYDTVFARQVEAYGEPGGTIIGLSTSGNSKNVVAAFEQAKSLDMTTIGLTGEGGGAMATTTNHLLTVPSRSTPLIQQVHICLYHYLCAQIEIRLTS
jgi:D-sedoheptulose 7-phosphate isomerase